MILYENFIYFLVDIFKFILSFQKWWNIFFFGRYNLSRRSETFKCN